MVHKRDPLDKRLSGYRVGPLDEYCEIERIEHWEALRRNKVTKRLLLGTDAFVSSASQRVVQGADERA